MDLNLVIIIVFLTLFVTASQTQTFDKFPNTSINLPPENLLHKNTEIFFGKALNFLAHLPFAFKRFSNQNTEVLSRFADKNNLEDQIIAEYTAGLVNEDAILSICELIVKYGYEVQKHTVKTEDGYLLTMFRIPKKGKPVFLMHGLLGSADDFVVAGPETGLAYLLARDGYDVWIGNARGNKHSRLHLKLDPSSSEFWDFSFHEIGVYDLPAMIDYVLNTTESKSIKYVGHSQGSTVFFVMTSERPEFNNKISTLIALSPVAYVTNTKMPLIKMLALNGNLILRITRFVGAYEFLPDNNAIKFLKNMFCGNAPLSRIFCSNMLFVSFGIRAGQLNITNLPVVMGHMPSGTSIKQLAHFGQGVVSQDFRKFVYGEEQNLEIYGSAEPSRYALDKVTVPVALFYSEDDLLAEPADVERLFYKLSNVIDLYKVPYKPFNHLDFLLAKDFKNIIYKRLITLITRVE